MYTFSKEPYGITNYFYLFIMGFPISNPNMNKGGSKGGVPTPLQFVSNKGGVSDRGRPYIICCPYSQQVWEQRKKLRQVLIGGAPYKLFLPPYFFLSYFSMGPTNAKKRLSKSAKIKITLNIFTLFLNFSHRSSLSAMECLRVAFKMNKKTSKRNYSNYKGLRQKKPYED